ncbi:MAG: tRNA uridine-5-carboxymethylaminomethyl(34) synthesis GTPase MnmE, partial [Bacteroidota bacterium]|nr:tRNA uridine-5-carboxymethylaminomethyl(34) synthesis GTPase MnmE [Bacteroidota bacterium]
MTSNSAFAYTINKDTICALATPNGSGAIAIIRLSGPNSFSIGDSIFTPSNKEASISIAETHKLLFGVIKNEENEILDEVLISVFRNPHSYTGEDSIEISCHGSEYIQQKILELLITKGARLANPGEYTMRAFGNGKLDLSQAEAVADLISSHSKTSHHLALRQMRGGYSKKIKELRSELVNFASLIELELDFSEEDIEFANRDKLFELLNKLKKEITELVSSFAIGNVIKKGI